MNAVDLKKREATHRTLRKLYRRLYTLAVFLLLGWIWWSSRAPFQKPRGSAVLYQTNMRSDGDFGGFEKADRFCDADANKPLGPGKAYATMPRAFQERIGMTPRKIFSGNGTLIADSWEDLLRSDRALEEFGLENAGCAWTGDGCDGWTSREGTGSWACADTPLSQMEELACHRFSRVLCVFY